MHFFTVPSDADKYISDGTEGDMRVRAWIQDDETKPNFSISINGKHEIIIHTTFEPVGYFQLFNRGRILSRQDLSEAAVIIDNLKTNPPFNLVPHSLGIILKDGELFYTADGVFHSFTTPKKELLYCGILPKQPDAADSTGSPFKCPQN